MFYFHSLQKMIHFDAFVFQIGLKPPPPTPPTPPPATPTATTTTTTRSLVGVNLSLSMRFGHFFQLLGSSASLDVTSCSSAVSACEKAQEWQMAIAIFKKSMDSQLTTWGREFDLGMMYFPTKWGAKEPQNPQNHRVAKVLLFLLLWQQKKKQVMQLKIFFLKG